jgi:hypothetical protein
MTLLPRSKAFCLLVVVFSVGTICHIGVNSTMLSGNDALELNPGSVIANRPAGSEGKVVRAPRSTAALPAKNKSEVSGKAQAGSPAATGPVNARAVQDLTLPNKAAKPSVLLGHIGPDGPAIATAGPNKGKPCDKCVFVAVTTCCSTWPVTSILLQQLLQSNDNIHVAVFDDMSTDGLEAGVKALGLPLVRPPGGASVGLTRLMNHAWQYYADRPELDVLYIMNNDLQMSPLNTFSKLARCLHSIEVGPSHPASCCAARERRAHCACSACVRRGLAWWGR